MWHYLIGCTVLHHLRMLAYVFLAVSMCLSLFFCFLQRCIIVPIYGYCISSLTHSNCWLYTDVRKNGQNSLVSFWKKITSLPEINVLYTGQTRRQGESWTTRHTRTLCKQHDTIMFVSVDVCTSLESYEEVLLSIPPYFSGARAYRAFVVRREKLERAASRYDDHVATVYSSCTGCRPALHN